MERSRQKDLILKVQPSGFSLITSRSDGVMFEKGLLTVIYSESVELDGKIWVHLSMARKNKYVSYEEMIYIKDVFLGDVKCFMVLPERKHHVNIHRYCFHLWHCPSGSDVPDFDRGFGTI